MSVSELPVARCHTCGHLLRGAAPDVPTVLVNGPLSIDFRACRVRVDGADVPLTPLEYRLLAFLARRVGEMVTWPEITDHLMGSSYVGPHGVTRVNRNHSVRTHLCRLRPKLGAAASLIESRPRQGLMLRDWGAP